MENITVHVTLTFEVVPDEALARPRIVGDATDRASRAIDLKDKPGVVLTRVSCASSGAGTPG